MIVEQSSARHANTIFLILTMLKRIISAASAVSEIGRQAKIAKSDVCRAVCEESGVAPSIFKKSLMSASDSGGPQVRAVNNSSGDHVAGNCSDGAEAKTPAKPCVEVTIIDAANEGDDSDVSPFAHDDKACSLKSCWQCTVKKNWDSWRQDTASESPDGRLKLILP